MASCNLRLFAIVVASAHSWYLEEDFDSFGFKSPHSGKCLDLPGGGDDTSNGINLWMWECLGEDSQQWYASEDQKIVFGGQVKGFKCIELLNGNVSNGQPVQFWDCRKGDAQAWGFDPDKGIIYFGTSADEATKCLRAGGQNNGDTVTIWDCIDGDPDQVWTFGPVVRTGAYICASQEGDECSCTGVVYFGRKYVAGNRSVITSLSQMQQTPYKTDNNVAGSISCDTGSFGDPSEGVHKQCFCVPNAHVVMT